MADFRSYQRQNTDWNTLAQHRNSKCRAEAPKFLCLAPSIVRIRFHVGDLNHSAFDQCSPTNRASVGFDGNVFGVIHEFGWEAIKFAAVKDAVDLARGRGHLGITEFRCRFNECLEHGFEIESLTTNALEHFGRRRLLLQRLSQLVK